MFFGPDVKVDVSEVQEGEWVDMDDTRVCVTCRTFGALFNAISKGTVRIDPKEVEAVNAVRDSQRYKNAAKPAAARDQGSGDIRRDAIEIATEFDQEGLLRTETQRRGVAPGPAEVNAAIDAALADSRAVADVQAGARVGGIVTDEAIVARVREGIPGAVRPEFVGAVLFRGGQYSVSTSRGRWSVFNSVEDRLVATEENWWLALLIAAELERRRRESEDDVPTET